MKYPLKYKLGPNLADKDKFTVFSLNDIKTSRLGKATGETKKAKKN